MPSGDIDNSEKRKSLNAESSDLGTSDGISKPKPDSLNLSDGKDSVHTKGGCADDVMEEMNRNRLIMNVGLSENRSDTKDTCLNQQSKQTELADSSESKGADITAMGVSGNKEVQNKSHAVGMTFILPGSLE